MCPIPRNDHHKILVYLVHGSANLLDVFPIWIRALYISLYAKPYTVSFVDSEFFSQPFILQLYVALLFPVLLKRIYVNGSSSSIPSGMLINPLSSAWLATGGKLSPADFLLSANSCSSTTTSVV